MPSGMNQQSKDSIEIIHVFTEMPDTFFCLENLPLYYEIHKHIQYISRKVYDQHAFPLNHKEVVWVFFLLEQL